MIGQTLFELKREKTDSTRTFWLVETENWFERPEIGFRKPVLRTFVTGFKVVFDDKKKKKKNRGGHCNCKCLFSIVEIAR